MPAKDIRFSSEARERMLHRVDILADAVKVTLGPKSPQRVDREVIRCPAHLQGRCDRRQGNPVARSLREHGRLDGSPLGNDHRYVATDVRHNIEQAFKRNAELEASHVTVTAEGDTITLSGTVRTCHEREMAEGAVWSAPGIKHVRNEITVQP